ncbi:MAG: hypothetical protein Q9214_004896 [Letrouitia sp. 1 TL-2023]
MGRPATSKSRRSNSNTTTPSDTSMTDVNTNSRGVKGGDNDEDSAMVRNFHIKTSYQCLSSKKVGWNSYLHINIANSKDLQNGQDTPDYSDSDTNPNTTASSVVGDVPQIDGRKRRSEASQLRKSVFGKKHNRLDESKVGAYTTTSMISLELMALLS